MSQNFLHLLTPNFIEHVFNFQIPPLIKFVLSVYKPNYNTDCKRHQNAYHRKDYNQTLCILIFYAFIYYFFAINYNDLLLSRPSQWCLILKLDFTLLIKFLSFLDELYVYLIAARHVVISPISYDHIRIVWIRNIDYATLLIAVNLQVKLGSEHAKFLSFWPIFVETDGNFDILE